MKAGLDPWETWDFSCATCDWKGPGSALQQGHMAWDGCEELCPSCREFIAWLEFPLADEMLAHADKLTPEDKAMALFVSKGHKRWNESKLKSVDQLPEIEADYIVLTWDEDAKAQEIVIRHGRDEIFRQPASWEYYDFFIAACRILKAKYGDRLLDVFPTPRVDVSIHGDSLTASNLTEEMRRLIGFHWTGEKKEAWKTFRKNHDD